MKKDGQDPDAVQTILLFSLPRSGSTWIGKILDSHPRTVYRHEPDSTRQISGIPLFPEDVLDAELASSFRSYCSGILSTKDSKVCGKSPIFPKAYLNSMRLFGYRGTAGFAKLASRFGVSMPVLGAPIGDEDSVLVWKSIESLGRLGVALNALPNAKGILLVRHPCGYVASVLRGQSQRQFEDNAGSGEDYEVLKMLLATEYAREQEISIDRLRTMATEERLAWRWTLANTNAIRDTGHFRHRCPIVLYEEVCEDPIAVSHEVFNQVGLDWNRQTEEFILKSTGRHGESYYGVFKNPSVAANKWRDELDTGVVDKILAITERSEAGALFSD